MDDEQDDRGLGHVVVDASEDPTAKHLVLNEVDALPRALSVSAVARPKHEAGNELDDDGKRQSAAPHIPPTGTTWDPLEKHRTKERSGSGAIVEPVEECSHCTGVFTVWPA